MQQHKPEYDDVDYLQVLKRNLQIEIKKHQLNYKKDENNRIILYTWKDGFAYRAPYRCLPKSLFNQEVICTYIENKLQGTNRRVEYNLFIEELHDEYPVLNVNIKQLEYADEILLDDLRQQCDREDIEQAQIEIHDFHVLGAFMEDQLIGVCSIQELWGAYDIGILIHPHYRRRGVSTMLVAENTKYALAQQKICMYRCEASNIGSYHTALKLGYHKAIEIIIYDLNEGV